MGLKEKLTRLREDALDRNPAARIGRWTGAVAELYDQIEGWLSEYIRDGLMVARREKVALEESVVGGYDIERLEFDLPAGRVLVFDPVGLDILDAEGRLDMYVLGARSEGASLLLDPKPGTLAGLAGMPAARGWFLRPPLPPGLLGRIMALSERRPHEPDVPLTRENLETMIETLLG